MNPEFRLRNNNAANSSGVHERNLAKTIRLPTQRGLKAKRFFRNGLTVSDGVLLQQIGHVYVNDASLLYHQVVAVRDLAAPGSTCVRTNKDFRSLLVRLA